MGAYPQKCIISPRFLLKIYYKKTQLGEGRLSLSVLRAGERDGRGPEAAPAARTGRRASLPGALAHHLQVVLLQLGAEHGVLVLQLLDLPDTTGHRQPGLAPRGSGLPGAPRPPPSPAAHLLPQELIVHLQPLGLLEGLLHALVGLAQLPDVVAGLRQDPSFTLGGGHEHQRAPPDGRRPPAQPRMTPASGGQADSAQGGRGTGPPQH